MDKKILSTFIFNLMCILVFGQTQIGQDIDGEAAGDYFGWSMSLSDDGNVLAVGSVSNDDSGPAAGSVRIYTRQSDNWIQLGNDIDGEAGGDQFGSSVNLSWDGSVVAIGARFNDANGANSGHVRIYQLQSGIWTQVGSTINGEFTEDQSGFSVSLSADGTIVAIGAIYNDGNGDASGQVRIYRNQSGVWTQLGNDIDGEAADNQSGYSVSLSNNGGRVAIGARFATGNGSASGHVRVYQLQSGSWSQIGDDIDGEAINDFSGWSVSLSGQGTVVAIGATANDGNGTDSGQVRVYSEQSGIWTQIGSDIDGENPGDQFGFSVSLSNDGSVLAAGARYNDDNGMDSGQVRIYRNESGVWNQLGMDIAGETAEDQFGWSVSLSVDASLLAVSARYNDGNGLDSGSVRVYDLSAILSTDEFILKQFNLYPNPAKNQFIITLNEGLQLENVNIYNSLGQFISSFQEKTIDTSQLATGVYYVEIITDKGKAIKKLIIE